MTESGPPEFTKLVRNILALGAGQIVTWTCTALMVALLPRYLGDDHLGKYAFGFFLANVLGLITDLGSGAFLTKEVARSKDPDSLNHVTFNAIFLRIPLAVLASGVGVALVNLLQYDNLTKNAFYAFFPFIIFQSLFQMLSATLMGIQKIQPLALSGALSKIVYTVAVVFAISHGYSLITIASFASIGPIVSLIFVVPYARRYIHMRFEIDWRCWKAICLGGLPFLVWQASLTFYGQIDILQLSLMTSDAVVGWYSASYQLILIPAFLPTIVITALYPMLAGLAQTNREDFSRLAMRGLELMLVIITPLAFGTAVLSSQIVDFMGYPAGFDSAVPLITILALHVPAAAASTLVGTYLLTLDRQKKWAMVGLVAALMNPIINLALIPITDSVFSNGAIGAAIATDVTEVFMLSWGLLLLPKGILQASLVPFTVRCLAAGGLMALVAWAVSGDGILVAVPAGAVVYLTASLFLGTARISDVGKLIEYIKGRKSQSALLIASES